MLERLNRSSSSTSSLERHFVLIVTRAEKPHSQRYCITKGKIILKAFSHSSGYSCETCIQNFIKLTLGCNIFNVVSLVSSKNWFNSDVGKFNDSTFAINGLEPTKNCQRPNHQSKC